MKLRQLVVVISIFFAAALLAADAGTSTARQDIETADAIEALFLGSGPLTPSNGFAACSMSNYWSGFPRGTEVTVRISSTVSADVGQAVQRALHQVPLATNGEIRATLELSGDPNPLPRRNEVTLAIHPDPVSQGCPFERGCTMHEFKRGEPGVLLSSRVVQPSGMPANAYVHDVIGHGIMGFCHIDGHLIGGPANSLMSGGHGVFSGQIAIELAPLDLDAARAVYDSSLDPGATRSDFLEHRLIRTD